MINDEVDELMRENDASREKIAMLSGQLEEERKLRKASTNGSVLSHFKYESRPKHNFDQSNSSMK